MTNYQIIGVITGVLLFGAVSAYAVLLENPNDSVVLKRAFACGYAYAQHNDHRTCPDFSSLGKITDINGQYGLIPP